MICAGKEAIRFGVFTIVTRPAGCGLCGALPSVQPGGSATPGSGCVQPGGGEDAVGRVLLAAVPDRHRDLWYERNRDLADGPDARGAGELPDGPLDAGVRYGDEFKGERIPTLAEVLALTDGHCALNIELKSAGVERKVCDLIVEHRALASAMVSGFDWDALAIVRHLDFAAVLQTLRARLVKPRKLPWVERTGS
jgi:hypothetical protein